MGTKEEFQDGDRFEFGARSEGGAAFCLEGFLKVIAVTLEEVEVVGGCFVGDVEEEVARVWCGLFPCGYEAYGFDDGVGRWSWSEVGWEWG